MAGRLAIAAALSDVPLVALAAPGTRRRLLEAAARRRFATGSAIFRAGDVPAALYVLVSGVVLILGRTPQGREVVTEILHPPTVFGDSAILARDVYRAGARAATASLVAEIPVSEVDAAREADAAFASQMLRGLLHRMQNDPRDWMRLVALPATRRVAGYLALQPATRPDGAFRIPVRKTDLASYLQLANATFSRAVRVLQDESLIRVSGRWITITDRGALERFARNGSPRQAQLDAATAP